MKRLSASHKVKIPGLAQLDPVRISQRSCVGDRWEGGRWKRQRSV